MYHYTSKILGNKSFLVKTVVISLELTSTVVKNEINSQTVYKQKDEWKIYSIRHAL